MIRRASIALLGALLLPATAALAELLEQGELEANVQIKARLTLPTCDLVLTDRSGTPIPGVQLQQIESGVSTGPAHQTEFALSPKASDTHCFSNVPDVSIEADYESMGTGNIINRGSAGNVAVRLWGITAGGPTQFSAAQPTLALPVRNAGALWFSAGLGPVNPALAISAGTVQASAAFNITYK